MPGLRLPGGGGCTRLCAARSRAGAALLRGRPAFEAPSAFPCGGRGVLRSLPVAGGRGAGRAGLAGRWPRSRRSSAVLRFAAALPGRWGFLVTVAALGHPEMVTDTRLKMLAFSLAGDSMRERELESWGHLKSGGCHQRFLTPSKSHSFFCFL